MLGHQGLDGLALAGAGVAEAHPAAHQLPDAQLVHAQLRVAALGIADDEETVGLGQLLHGLPDPGVADLALVLKEIAVLGLHAPLHELVAFRLGDGGEEGVADLGHDLAEEGPQGLGVGAQVVQALGLQLDVVTLGNQGTGVPESAVNVKNQAFKFHITYSPDDAQCG